MTHGRMRRQKQRRARAVRHSLDRYHQQLRIEEELDRLLSPLRQSPSGLSPSNPFILSEAGNAGPVVGLAEEMKKWQNSR